MCGHGLVGNDFADTEVGQFDGGARLVGIVKQVFWLQVSMDNSHFVEIAHSVDNWQYDLSCFCFRVVVLLYNPIEQLAACHEFEDQTVLILVLIDFVELNDVGMVYLTHDDDLIFE